MAGQTSPKTAASSNGPISPLRVLELADEKGQFCGKLLAEMGADVIKVEPPGGRPTRSYGPFMDDQPDPQKSLYFWHYNTSKRGVTLDLEAPEGKELFRRLVQSSDVLVETFPPGYLAGLGLGYESLAELNPGLVMASITPFGQTGPYRDFKTSDLVSSALGGMMFSCGYDDVPGSPPVNPDGGQTLHMASQYAAIATLAAIWARSFTGRGQYIDVSIHQSVNCTTEWAVPIYWYHGLNIRRQTGRHAAHVDTHSSQVRARDGRYVNLLGVMPRDVNGWNNLLDWMEERGAVGDLRDPKYTDLVAGRVPGISFRNAHTTPEGLHLIQSIVKFVESLDSNEAYHGGQQRGLIWSIVRPPDDILEDDHWWDRGFFTRVAYPELDKEFIHPGVPYRFGKSEVGVSRRAPLIGEHNDAVYATELGLSPEELAELAVKGVI